jgi:hypothetical protein
MTRIPTKLFAVVLLGCWAGVAVHADRLIIIPEGTTLTTGAARVEYAGHESKQAYWAAVGISRLEVEGAWFKGFGAGNANALSAQVGVLPETSFTPALALGVRDIGDKTDDEPALYAGRSFYVAASKSVPLSGGEAMLQELKVHVGIGTGSLKGVFFGAETTLPGKVQLAGEYDTETFNFAATYSVAPFVKMRVSSIGGDAYYGALVSASF